MPRLTEQLRASVREVWEPAVRHRFVRELCTDRLPDQVLRRYLVQDYQFADAFVALLGATVASADSTAARMVHARQLGVIGGEENTYFQRAFDTLGVPESERVAPELLPATVAFNQLMRETGESRDYLSCLTVLTVAEWLYLDWAQRASEPGNPLAREWITLHDNPPFIGWVDFLRDEVDRLGPGAPERCRALFARTTRLELEFFEAVYPT